MAWKAFFLNLPIFRDYASFWRMEFFGNTVQDYFLFVILFFVFLAVFKIFQVIILYKLDQLAKKTKTDIDDTLVEIIDTLKPPFYFFVAFYFSLQFLNLNYWFSKIIHIILVAWVIYQVIIALQILTNYIIKKSLRNYQDDHAKAALKMAGKLVTAVLWMVGILLFLSNLGVNITSLVAGLGIGGVAVALALQNILGDLFSSFAIYFDRPFAIDDFIIVGDYMGVVEKIGIKTTRLRALRGEEIVIPNKELVSSKIQNFKRMNERRIVFNIGVVYDTPTEKMKKIPQIIEKIITEVKLTRFDRAHFYEFGDSALLFEVVYYIQSPEYMDYVRANQEILLKIKEAFEKEDIEMAYPTQTIYLAK